MSATNEGKSNTAILMWIKHKEVLTNDVSTNREMTLKKKMH